MNRDGCQCHASIFGQSINVSVITQFLPLVFCAVCHMSSPTNLCSYLKRIYRQTFFRSCLYDCLYWYYDCFSTTMNHRQPVLGPEVVVLVDAVLADNRELLLHQPYVPVVGGRLSRTRMTMRPDTSSPSDRQDLASCLHAIPHQSCTSSFYSQWLQCGSSCATRERMLKSY